MGHNNEDLRTWAKEWRLWAGVSVILVLVWVVWSLFRGSFDGFWPLGVIVVWAVILLCAPLFPSNRRSGGTSVDPGGRPPGDRDA